MKQQLIKFSTLTILVLIALLNLNYSSNPPIDRTNRTGSNCTGCHTGSLNPSGGSLSLSGSNSYYPGKTYTISTTQTGGVIYGFEMTAVRSSNISLGVGSFSGVGFNTTTNGGRPYARHNNASTTSSYNITWQSPSSNIGSVNFYAAGVSANSNGNNGGDKTYATTKIISGLDKISFSFDTTSITCFGTNNGKIKIKNITGGNGAPYSFQWSGSSSTNDSLVNLGPGTYNVSITDNDNNTETASITLGTPPAILNTFTILPTICGDSTGTLVPNVSGGTPPYTIKWPPGIIVSNDSALNLKSGAYTITITDNSGCSINDLATVGTNGSHISFQVNTNPEFCNNGWGEAFVANLSGTVGNTNYSWSNNTSKNTADNLSSGNYSITVTDGKGCQASNTFNITNQSNTISFDVNLSNDKCNQNIGFAIVSNTSGGVFPYSYLWSTSSVKDSIGNLAKGNYTVTVTDSVQCSFSKNVIIDDIDAPKLSLSAPDLTCYEDSNGVITSTVTGGSLPYRFLWANGNTDSIVDQLKGGLFYNLTVTDAGGCIAIDSIMLNRPSKLEIDTLVQTVENLGPCDEELYIKIKGGSPNYTYLWSNGTTDSNLTDLCTGDYFCTVTDSNNCVIVGEFSVVDNDNTGIHTYSSRKLTLYPNPINSDAENNGRVFITSKTVITSISIIELSGQLLEEIVENDITEIETSWLKKGTYIIKITDKNNHQQIRRLVKK